MHFIHRADADGGQGKGDLLRFGRTRRLHFAAPRHHAGQPDGRQCQRQGAGLPCQSGAGIDPLDVDQHTLARADVLPVGNIGLEGVLVGGATVDVIEQERR
ncbi:hypothetical protein D3C76_1040590 [compost metagenome]